MKKTYAIADIHGRADLLMRAAELIVADCVGEKAPNVIVLGDFIDRGPGAAKVVAMLRTMQEKAGWRVLQGNHEAMMISAMSDPSNLHTLGWWFGNGGDRTLMSYGYTDDDMPNSMEPVLKVKATVASDVAWLKGLPIWIGDKHRIFVHAGVPFDKQVGECKQETLQWHLYDHYASDEHHEPHLWADFPHISGKHIVHGHHQHFQNPVRTLKHRTNLDSFAWSSGRLAIGVFDDDVPGGPVKILDAIGRPA